MVCCATTGWVTRRSSSPLAAHGWLTTLRAGSPDEPQDNGGRKQAPHALRAIGLQKEQQHQNAAGDANDGVLIEPRLHLQALHG